MTMHFFWLTVVMDEPGGVSRPAPLRSRPQTGGVDRGVPDLVIDTDHRGLPHIPATSFAGALRARVREMAPEQETAWFGHVSGDTATASSIWVLGSRMLDEHGSWAAGPVTPDTTTTTAINRHTGAAAVNTLRVAESLPAGTTFSVYLRWDTDGPITGLLNCLSEWRPLIGRATSTGHGYCRVTKVRTGSLDLTKPADLARWLTESGPRLVQSVARTDQPLTDAQPSTRGYAVTLTTTGPLAFSLTSDGTLSSHSLPGASIKGVIRSRMEYILRSVGLLEPDKCGGTGCGACLVCQVFGHSTRDRRHRRGSVGQRARLRTVDAPVHGQTRLRTHVPLDRFTGGAAMASKDEARVYVAGHRGGLLHTVEGIERGELTLRFMGELPDQLAAGFEALLVLVLNDLDDGLLGLGRATTRGYGGVSVKAALRPDGTSLPSVANAQAWLAGEVAAAAAATDGDDAARHETPDASPIEGGDA